MIRAPDPSHRGNVRTQVVEGLEVILHDLPRRLVALHEEPVDRGEAVVEVVVDRELLVCHHVLGTLEVAPHILPGPQQALLLTPPKSHPDRAPGLDVERFQNPESLGHDRGAVRVVRRAGTGMP